MATVADVLAKKHGGGGRVWTVSPGSTVLVATRLMNRHKVGALVVTMRGEASADSGSPDGVVGIFTERDVLSRVVVEQLEPSRTLVEDVMTRDLVYATPDMPLEEVSTVMRARRIRHLPVCDGGGNLRGLISIGDLNAWDWDGQNEVIHYLNEYIYGRI